MAIDPSKLTHSVRDAITQNRDGKPNWSTMTQEQAFNYWCIWHGFIEWAPVIKSALNEINNASR